MRLDVTEGGFHGVRGSIDTSAISRARTTRHPVHLRLPMASKLTHLSLQQFRWVVAYNNQLCWTQVRRSARVAEPNAASIRWLLRAVDVQFAPASMASRL